MWVIHWGLLLRLPWRAWVCPCEGQVWRWCSCLGSRESGSTRYSKSLAARAAGNMATRRVWLPVLANTLQYSCLENSLSDREAWQATVYSVTKSQTRPKRPCRHRCKTFFACGSSAPLRVECESGEAALLAGTLAGPSVQGHGLPPPRSYGPFTVLFQASCSWQSEGLFGQSFSGAPPIQALRGFPCLGYYFAVVGQSGTSGIYIFKC